MLMSADIKNVYGTYRTSTAISASKCLVIDRLNFLMPYQEGRCARMN